MIGGQLIIKGKGFVLGIGGEKVDRFLGNDWYIAIICD